MSDFNFDKYREIKNKILQKPLKEQFQQNKLVILSFVFGILIFLAIAAFLPFKDQLFSILYPKPKSQATEIVVQPSTVQINKKVYMLIFDPVLSNGKKLSIDRGWASSTDSANIAINTFKDVSGGRVNYSIAYTKEINDQRAWLTKTDGFKYTEASYAAVLANDGLHHEPDYADYYQFLGKDKEAEFDICGKLNRGEIDELWLFAGPRFGFYETALTGPAGYWVNGPTFTNTLCNKLMIIGLPNLHNYGHLAETTMQFVYNSQPINALLSSNITPTTWDKYLASGYTMSTTTNPVGCGSIHYSPPAQIAADDYDHSFTGRFIKSYCDDFYNYPNLGDPNTTAKSIDCSTWGCSEEGYLAWWWKHLPHFTGADQDGVLNDWWQYIFNPNLTYQFKQPTNGTFSNLSGDFPKEGPATFNFTYSGKSSIYSINASTLSNMSYDVYGNFAAGSKSPVILYNPKCRWWSKYSCGKTLYWQITSQIGDKSPIMSTTVGCTAPAPKSLTASPDRTDINGQVSIAWNGVDTCNPEAWIGLYKKDDPDTSNKSKQTLVSCSPNSGGAVPFSGTCSVTVPQGLAAGLYEFRMFDSNSATNKLAASNQITIYDPLCTTLYNKIVESKPSVCGDSKYNFVADLDINKSVNDNDLTIFSNTTGNGTVGSACNKYLQSITNPCVSPVCLILKNRIQAASPSVCGDVKYDKVADLNRDKSINDSDLSKLNSDTNGLINGSVCQTDLNSTYDPCMTVSCRSLFDKIQASSSTSCGQTNYNYVADLNFDKSVNSTDMDLFNSTTSKGTRDDACVNYLNAKTNPCISPVCVDLQNKITTAFLSTCGDAKYNKAVDLTKDKYINGADMSKLLSLSKNFTDGNACLSALNDPADSCINRVFVTSTTYTGNLGGLSGADAKCQTQAKAARLPGTTYKAWISDSTGSPSTRFIKSTLPYRLVDGTTVANNWDDLIVGLLRHKIDKTESNLVKNGVVWTFTNYNSYPVVYSGGQHCSNWTSAGFSGQIQDQAIGTNNSLNNTLGEWTFSLVQSCDKQASLYCFQQ